MKYLKNCLLNIEICLNIAALNSNDSLFSFNIFPSLESHFISFDCPQTVEKY